MAEEDSPPPPPQGGPHWAQIPKIRPTGCPQGLELLVALDMFVIGIERENKHFVRNRKGQQIFDLVESTSSCTRLCCCRSSTFSLKLFDRQGQEVIRMRHPCSCNSCCCRLCCLQSIKVYSPPGTYIGKAKQNLSCRPHFTIKNSSGEKVLFVRGWPRCCRRQTRVELEIVDNRKLLVGRMAGYWMSLGYDDFPDYDVFGAKFPMDLDVQTKATLIGACFLIYMMYM